MSTTSKEDVGEERERTLLGRVQDELVGTTTEALPPATTTREEGGVRLSRESDGSVYASWTGSFEDMPYYYCAPVFPRYSTTSESEVVAVTLPPEPQTALVRDGLDTTEPTLIHPIQRIEEDTPCDRRIKIESPTEILGFTFFPQSTDFVIITLADGIYITEIDNRAWQNIQPLIRGENLSAHVENGALYVYDGILIYQIILEA